MLYNFQGQLQERFVLVDIPNVLYAGFSWTLKRLQNLSKNDRQIALLSTIIAGMSPEVALPEYTTADGFEFRLDSLRTESNGKGQKPLRLRPKEICSHGEGKINSVEMLCQETTLDHGQAEALCESLCRDFAFTQGPPGTGKS